MIKHFFQDKNGRIAVWQRPNLPLAIWFTASIFARLTDGTVKQTAGTVATLALMVWSLLEVFSGISYFRRALGLLVLSAVIWRIASRV